MLSLPELIFNSLTLVNNLVEIGIFCYNSVDTYNSLIYVQKISIALYTLNFLLATPFIQ